MGNEKPATNNTWCFKMFYTTWDCGKWGEIGYAICVDTAGHSETHWGCNIWQKTSTQGSYFYFQWAWRSTWIWSNCSKKSVRSKISQVCCKNKHQISRLQCQKPLAWCKLNRHKTVNDFWKKVIYSYECKVELGMDNRVLIWRQSGKEWTPPCLNPGRGCRVSLAIWVYKNYEGVGTLTVVDGNINAKNILKSLITLYGPLLHVIPRW